MMKTYSLLMIVLCIITVLSCSTESTPTYTLTTTSSPDEGGTITPNTGNFDEGETISLQATPAEGWVFSGWEQDLNTTANPVNINMNRDYNVVGVFERMNYSLNIIIEGEGEVEQEIISSPKTTEYPFETMVELTAIPKNYWTFTGWSGDISGTETTVTLRIDGDKSVTASFEIANVTSPTGRIWMDRNLGASRAATSSTDEQAYGDFYQWGRGADGHQKRNSPTTSTLSSSDQPGHGSFIIGSSDWRSPKTTICGKV